jgi:hypothetical protein
VIISKYILYDNLLYNGTVPATKLSMKRHKKRHPRTTDKHGIHAKDYQDMAIRSIDNTKKEKQKSETTRIPEKKSTPSTNSVNKPQKEELKEDEIIVVPALDSSDNDSLPKMEEPHNEKPGPGEVSLKEERAEGLNSENKASSQELDDFSLPQPSQRGTQSADQANISSNINAQNLEEREASIKESKQEAQNENVDFREIGFKQELEHKTIDDDKRLKIENDYAKTSSKYPYPTPWLQAADAWTRLYAGYVENAFVMTEYWLDQFSTIWLGGHKKIEKVKVE